MLSSQEFARISIQRRCATNDILYIVVRNIDAAVSALFEYSALTLICYNYRLIQLSGQCSEACAMHAGHFPQSESQYCYGGRSRGSNFL